MDIETINEIQELLSYHKTRYSKTNIYIFNFIESFYFELEMLKNEG